jgi:hypothetical protein
LVKFAGQIAPQDLPKQTKESYHRIPTGIDALMPILGFLIKHINKVSFQILPVVLLTVILVAFHQKPYSNVTALLWTRLLSWRRKRQS